VKYTLGRFVKETDAAAAYQKRRQELEAGRGGVNVDTRGSKSTGATKGRALATAEPRVGDKVLVRFENEPEALYNVVPAVEGGLAVVAASGASDEAYEFIPGEDEWRHPGAGEHQGAGTGTSLAIGELGSIRIGDDLDVHDPDDNCWYTCTVAKVAANGVVLSYQRSKHWHERIEFLSLTDLVSSRVKVRQQMRWPAKPRKCGSAGVWPAVATSSKHSGVTWDKKGRKWDVGITHQGRRRRLGYFDDEAAAAEAFDEAARRLRGDQAHGGHSWGHTYRLNFPTAAEEAARKRSLLGGDQLHGPMPMLPEVTPASQKRRVKKPRVGRVPQTSGRTSRYIGVCWSKPVMKWEARIQHGSRGSETKKVIGYFKNEVAAAKAWDKAARKLPTYAIKKKAVASRSQMRCANGSRYFHLNFPTAAEELMEHAGGYTNHVAATSGLPESCKSEEESEASESE
jgi:hypothetical protein